MMIRIFALLFLSTLVSAAPSTGRLIYKCGVLKNSEGLFSKSAATLSIVQKKDDYFVKAVSLKGTEFEVLAQQAGLPGFQSYISKNYLLTVRRLSVRPGAGIPLLAVTLKSRFDSTKSATCESL